MKISVLLLGAALFAVPAVALADSPQEFLSKALQGDNSEIMLGRLAQDRAADPGVRDYGRTLENDHSQARNDVLNVGRRFGLRSRREDVSGEARNERDRLQGMRGRDFDREFVQYMINDHRKDIGDFRDEARERHGAVSDLARNQLPTLQKHLDLAMSLSDRLDRGGDRGRFDGRDHGRDRPYGNNDRPYGR